MSETPRHVLRQPRWMATTAFILLVALGCVLLGLWQLDRYDERREANARLAVRMTEDPLDAEKLLAALDNEGADAVEYRRVVLMGAFVPDEEVLLRNRQHGGQPGWHVLTPLTFGDGTAVLVNRGWIPQSMDTPPEKQAAPASGNLQVDGILMPKDPQPTGFGPKDPDTGVLPRVHHADPVRLDAQTTDALLPVVVQLESQQPILAGALPIPVPTPEPRTGNHLSYALQWFSFAVIALVGYAAYLRSRVLARADRNEGV